MNVKTWCRLAAWCTLAIITHLVRTKITTTKGDETLNERETIEFHRRDGRWIAVDEHLSLKCSPQPLKYVRPPLLLKSGEHEGPPDKPVVSTL